MTKSTNGSASVSNGRASPGPPKIWNIQEPVFSKSPAVDPTGYQDSARLGINKTAIVIDNGSSTTRAGWSFDSAPRLIFPPVMSRYRERKLARTYTLVGHDASIDAAARGQIRTAFETGSGIVSNWDVMENVLDYIFLKLGVDGSEGGIGRPVVMTEPMANLGYPRKVMTEIMFECYSTPSLSYGIDSLFSYKYNGGKTGLVISSSHSATHLVPVIDHKPMLTLATRLNWGGSQNADFLLKLLQLKYPTFPGKMTLSQAEELVRQHCYVSLDYESELGRYLDWTGLEERDHVIQYPYTEQVVIQKSEEELARIAEKRKESGKRLQEQAAKMRLEKLIKKEQELEYYKDLQQKGVEGTKKDFKMLLESNDFETEAQLEKVVKELEKAIRKARTKDVGGGGVEEEVEEPPSFPLLDVPDAELDEAGIKQKRQQRLAKANVEARARAKAEKEKEKARVAEEKRLDEEKRENDLTGWILERRQARDRLLQKLKDRQRLKADLSNRKSHASQLRMKNIANLASDTPNSKKRRRGGAGGGEDNDTFGADDNDWGVYRTIATTGDNKNNANSDDEGGPNAANDIDEELLTGLNSLEADLLQYDTSFTEEDTHAAQTDWSKSLLHTFLRGPWPFDPMSTREANQMHLNIERIRVPEVVFQPAIAGLDQAGLVEVAGDIINTRLPSLSTSSWGGGVARGAGGSAGGGDELTETMLKDVFLTGGNILLENFDERVKRELRAIAPAGVSLNVRRAKDPLLDAWKGAAEWVGTEEWFKMKISREEYEEKGVEYITEHL
ncbi:MAG: Nuclear actin-protein involved in chromatin remodeling [Watsoniomyces obsoletus]|nr:MAG: Nuclear actin-protein involved in chromatin remodeling [Watsoniomyces obsoletus]